MSHMNFSVYGVLSVGRTTVLNKTLSMASSYFNEINDMPRIRTIILLFRNFSAEFSKNDFIVKLTAKKAADKNFTYFFNELFSPFPCSMCTYS